MHGKNKTHMGDAMGKISMPLTLGKYMVNTWCREVVVGTSFIQVTKLHRDRNGACFLENGIGTTILVELVNCDCESLSL